MNYSLRAFLIFTCLLLAACAPKQDTTAAEGPETYYSIRLDQKELQLQLALVPAEQAKGLMFRDPLPADHGMLFVFSKAEQRSFWMRNTKIPLDLGYFDASGQLIEIHALYPYDETPVQSRSHEILMALEMNQGWFQRAGIAPGAQLNMKALKQAIRDRGQPLNHYPLD